jgi:hypothetical protein
MTAVDFPFRFSFEQARRQAKDLQRAWRAEDPQALARLKTHHPEKLQAAKTQLADAQLVVAREHGFESWPKLKAYTQPEVLYQSEMITEGNNDFINGRPWPDQEAILHQLAKEALEHCGLSCEEMTRAGHMGNFGYSDFALAVRTSGKSPSYLATVHYAYDDKFSLDEVHRQVASLCAWLFALGRDTALDIQVPLATNGGLCQHIDHRPDGPAAVCTVQRWVAGKDIISEDIWEGWDLKGDKAIDLQPEAMQKIGAVLGHIHTHGRTWSRPDGFNRMRTDWPTDLSELEYRFWNKRQDGDKPGEELELIRRTLDQLTRDRKAGGEPWGLTHGDFRMHNCVVDGDIYKPIDFDLCALSYQYDDIGWFFTDIQTPTLRRDFLDGYLDAAPQAADFLQLAEGALIAARVRRCAWGGKFPPRLVAECEKYLKGETFLLAG